MNKKRVALLLLILLVVIGGLKYKEAQLERDRQALEARLGPAPPLLKPVRDWRWASEPEWVVHQVLRLIVSWSIDNDGVDTTVAVRHKSDATPLGAFEVTLTGTSQPSLIVGPLVHIWDPGAYADTAARLLGAGPADSLPPIPSVSELLLSSDSASLVKADGLIFKALISRPRDARLHEQAALLWAAYAMRNSAASGVDFRPFLNGITAHLAIAQALSPGTTPGRDGEIAGIVMDVLLLRQLDAMRRIDALGAAPGDRVSRAWANALRTRITHDPRTSAANPPRTRIEKLEYLNAIIWSRPHCAEVFEFAARWRVRRAADWARDTLTCVDERYLSVMGNPIEMQAIEGMQLAAIHEDSVEEGVAALAQISRANTHQPARPSAIVPVEIRAEAGLRHVAQAYQAIFGGVVNKGIEGAARRFSEWAAPIRTLLPAEALLELAQSRPDARPDDVIESRDFVKAPPDICARVGKVLTDRPDLLSDIDWLRTQACIWDPSMKSVGRGAWDSIAIPGTGILTTGPWSQGPVDREPEFEVTLARAPWSWYHMAHLLHRKKGSRPFATSAELLEAYSRLLDYSTSVMFILIREADDPDLVQKLAERACALDGDTCGLAGARLAEWGRVDAALALGAQALARSRESIRLSTSVRWYVSALQERGRTVEAMRIARRMAEVYSAGGLVMLAKAHERMGEFKEAAKVYRLGAERYADSSSEDEFYVRHAERYGPSPFEDETRAAMDRLFPQGLRKIALGEALPAGRPLSLNDRRILTVDLHLAGLSDTDALVAVDGFVVQTQAQFHAILSFSDAPKTTFLVKRRDGTLAETTVPFHRRHFDLVSKARTRI